VLFLDLIVLVLVLRNGLGTRRLTVGRQVLPLVFALFLGFAYAGLGPTGGVLDITGAIAGIGCGFAAARLLRVGRSGDGAVVTSGAYAYAVLWIATIAGRYVLASWFPILVAPFVLMTLTMLVTRVVVTFLLARRARRSAHSE
jgi:hypothetical protein